MDIIDVDKRRELTDLFGNALRKELIRRGIPFVNVEVADSGVNLQVWIYIVEHFEIWPHTRYIAWSWFVGDILQRMSINQYAVHYAESYRHDLSRQCEADIREALRMKQLGHISSSYRSMILRREQTATAILEQLGQVID